MRAVRTTPAAYASLQLDTDIFCSQASEQPDAFWAFLESWQEPIESRHETCWDAIYRHASQHLSSGAALSLQQALWSRQYTAKVEMLRGLADPPQVLPAYPSNMPDLVPHALVHWGNSGSVCTLPSVTMDAWHIIGSRSMHRQQHLHSVNLNTTQLLSPSRRDQL